MRIPRRKPCRGGCAAEHLAEKTDTEEVVSDATAQAIVQTPIALLGTFLTTSGGTTSALSVARLGRNFPLVLLLVTMGALFWPAGEEDERVRLE